MGKCNDCNGHGYYFKYADKKPWQKGVDPRTVKQTRFRCNSCKGTGMKKQEDEHGSK